MNVKRVVGALLVALSATAGLVLVHHRSSAPVASVRFQRAPAVHRLLVVGASYSAGLGASSPSLGYAHLLGRSIGFVTTNVAVPGAGYLNPSRTRHSTFAEQVRLAPAARPGLVLVQGGRNDAGYPDAQIRAAVCATVGSIRQRWSGVDTVLMGNIPATLPVSARQQAVNRDLAVAARTCRVSLIDPIAENWITRTNAPRFTGSVPGHPNDAGHAYIAQRVRQDLERLGVLAGHDT